MKSTAGNGISIPLSRKSLCIVAGLTIVLAGGAVLWKSISNPPKPWLVRWRVMGFLKSHSEPKEFKIDFPFPSRAEMAAKPLPKKPATDQMVKGTLTGNDFDALKARYIKLQLSIFALERKEAQKKLMARQEALAPILSDLWDFQRAWQAEADAAEAGGVSRLASARALLVGDTRQRLDDAATYSEIYFAIGQELWVAKRLLSSANPEHRKIGISLALQAGQNAQNDAQNGWLAGRICEGFIWPYFDDADERNLRSSLNLQNLLDQCADIFRRNEEWQNVVRNYELLLARAGTPQIADSARVQIAMAHEQAGDLKTALQYLRAIKATNDFARALRRIPRLERQLKGS